MSTAFPAARLSALLPLSLTLLLGCAGPAEEHDHDDGDQESVVLMETAWNDRFEVALEHAPLIAGVPAHLTARVTDLPTGLPVRTGPLSLRWTATSGQTVGHDVPAPVRPGIYEVDVVLPAADHWSLDVNVGLSAEPLTVPVVRVYADPHVAEHAGPDMPPDAIVLTKEMQWRLGVRTAVVAVDTFIHRIRVPATVEAPPGRRIDVTTPVAGRLVALPGGRALALGDRVVAGQTLAVIHTSLSGGAADLAAADAALVRTTEELNLAEAELERATALVAAGAAPVRRAEEAQARRTAAEASRNAARRLLAGDGDAPESILRSPIDGQVVAVTAGPGEYVPAGAAVVVVLDPSLVWVRGLIPEVTLTDLPPHPRASLECAGYGGVACFSTELTSVYLAPEIDPASRTAAVVYAARNDAGHLRVGQALGLRLESRRREEAVVVPRDALVDEHGRPVVFVQTGGEVFVKRNVTVGGDDGVRSEVLEGLLPGERIAVGSAWVVKLAAAGSALPAHGHAH